MERINAITLKKPEDGSNSFGMPAPVKKTNAASNSDGNQSSTGGNGPIHLYFGSETGTAAGFCKILAGEAKKHNLQATVVDLALFDPQTFVLPKVAIFCLANQGEGEPTDNAEKFYNWLTSPERVPNTLNQIKFSVFGLGNKTYDNYNQVGKIVNQYLEKLGGERIYPHGEGDDNEDLEGDFEKWKANLWSTLKEKLDPRNANQNKDNEKLDAGKEEPPFDVVLMNHAVKEIEFNGKSDRDYDFQARSYLDAKEIKIVRAYELRQNTREGSTLQIEFDLSGSGMKYATAANLYVFPENDPQLVDVMAKKLGISLDKIFMIQEHKSSEIPFKHPVPSPISVKTYLTQFCELQGPVMKNTLRVLANYIEDHSKKHKLLDLISPKGQNLYEEEILKPMKGLVDVILEYDVILTLKELIYIAENIKPRPFTIASSSIKDSESLHICASLTGMTVNGGWRLGLASGYLKRVLEHFDNNPDVPLKTRAFAKPSIFEPPTDSKRPLIMVGPGAGLAPFRAFLQEKEYLVQKGINKAYGEITLYFGCRRSDSDYIYKDELEHYYKTGIISKLHVAFSREGSQKFYVQDLMKMHKAEISSILFEQNGLLYLCGSVSMGSDVQKALNQLATQHFNISEAEGEAKIRELEQSRRILKEVWG